MKKILVEKILIDTCIFIDEIISQKAMELIVGYNLSYNLLLADAIIAATCLTKGL